MSLKPKKSNGNKERWSLIDGGIITDLLSALLPSHWVIHGLFWGFQEVWDFVAPLGVENLDVSDKEVLLKGTVQLKEENSAVYSIYFFLKNVVNQTVSGPCWLPNYFFLYNGSQWGPMKACLHHWIKIKKGNCDFVSGLTFFSQLRVYISQFWRESELRDMNSQFHVIKSELWDINLQFWVIKSELWDINMQFWVIKSELWDINMQFWVIKSELWDIISQFKNCWKC